MPDNSLASQAIQPARTFGPEASRDISDGACLTCLAGGTVKFPLDPRHHLRQYGHVPELADLPKICTALGITAGRWESLAAKAVSELVNEENHV